MNFDGFESVDSSNERKSGGRTRVQKYDGLKYTRGMRKDKDGKELGVEGKFFVSNKQWNSLSLETFGLRQFTKTEGEGDAKKITGVVVGVVADEDSVILKRSEKGNKGKTFKSTRLEQALAATGVIDITALDVNQFINVSVAAENVTVKGTKCVKVLQFSKGEVKAKDPAVPKEPKAKKATDTAAPAEATQEAAAAPAAKSDWD